MVIEKLIKCLCPFIEAKNPSTPGDAEMVMWEMHMCHEVDDLKLKSFGIKLLHTISTVRYQGEHLLEGQEILGDVSDELGSSLRIGHLKPSPFFF
jgi:hypothetical protein